MSLFSQTSLALLNSYTVDNFGFLEVKEFITHWFKEQPELGEQLQIQQTQPEGEKTRHLLRTPFNLALLCQNWQQHQEELPTTKAKLYDQFVVALCPSQQQELHQELGKIALELVHLNQDRFQFQPELDLALRLGLIKPVDGDRYIFAHPSFQSYFAAQLIQDWHEFFNHTPQNPEQFTPTEPDYNESLLLAVAWSLGRLSPGSADAIATLTSLMQTDPELTRYRYTCCWAALRLWQIDPGNSQVISVLVDLLSESVSGHWKVASVASSILSDIGKGNVEAIKALTKKLQAAQENEIDEDTDAEEFINYPKSLG